MTGKRIAKALLVAISVPALVCFSYIPVYATDSSASTEDTTDAQNTIIEISNKLSTVASWIRIIPATIAGKLMTNSFVYGTAFHLDTYLFKFWQFVRTFALFALWFFFVWKLLLMMLKPDEATAKIGELVGKVFLSWILISASRWMIAALVDLSIVFTAAVWAIPDFIYAEKRDEIQTCFPVNDNIVVEGWLQQEPNTLTEDNTKLISRELISPQADDISWPLMFFWSSVLGFFQLSFAPDAPDASMISASVVVALVKIVMIVMLILPLVVLMIVNIIRVVVLWLWIVFAPALIILKTFGVDTSNITKSKSSLFNPKEIIALIFQPVAVIGMLSIGMILIIEMTLLLKACTANNLTDSTITATPTNEWISTTISDSIDSPVPEISIVASVYGIGDIIWWITGQLILAFFVLFLYWSLIQVGFSFSAITKETSDKIFKFANSAMGNLPIIPIGNGDRVGKTAFTEQAKKWFGVWGYADRKYELQTQNLNEKIDKVFGIDSNQRISETEFGELRRSVGKDISLEELWTTIRQATQTKSIRKAQLETVINEWLKYNEMANLKKLKITGINTGKYNTENINTIRQDEQFIKLINSIFRVPYPGDNVKSVINAETATTIKDSYQSAWS